MPLGVRFRHHRQQAARPAGREGKGVAHDPLDADAGEDGDLGRHFLRVAAMGAAALAGIFALAVFPHDHPVECTRCAIPQWRAQAGQHARRPHIGVLVEALADGEPQAPERDVVRHRRVTHRAEEDRVHVPDLVEPIGRHHQPGAAVVVRTPVEIGHVEAEAALALRQCLQHGQPGGDDLGAIPSPGMAAIRYVFICFLPACRGRGQRNPGRRSCPI